MKILSLINSNINDGKLIPQNTLLVCGAGISYKSGLPLGGELVDCLLNFFALQNLKPFFSEYNSKVISKIFSDTDTGLFNLPRLEILFNAVKQVLNNKDYENFVNYALFHKCSNSDGEVKISPNYNHFLISDFIEYGGKAITFNFDELIESAYQRTTNFNILPIVLPDGKNNSSNTNTLIKAHGSLGSATGDFKIGVDVSNLHIDGFKTIDNKLLDDLLNNVENIIFIGYSVSDTLDFIPYLNFKFKINKVNIYHFDFNPSATTFQYNQFDNLASDKNLKTGLIQFDKYLREITNRLYIIKYNPDILFSSLLTVSSVPTIEYKFDPNTIAEIKNNQVSQALIRLSVYKSLGLMNKFGEKDLSFVANCNIKLDSKIKKLKFEYQFYHENVNGKYLKNTFDLTKKFFWQPSIKNFLKVFGILNEYIYLTKRQYLMRGVFTIVTFCIWVGLILLNFIFSGKQDFKLELRRHIYMFPFRFLKELPSGFPLVKKAVIFLLTYIIDTKKLAIEYNSLNLFRFIEKERIKIQLFLFGFENNKILDDLDDLILKNIDTNYFVDINNLLRLKYSVANSPLNFQIALSSTELTKDTLNQSKI